MSVDVGYKKWLPGLGRWQYIPESFKVAVAVFDSAGDKIGGPTLCFPNADDSSAALPRKRLLLIMGIKESLSVVDKDSREGNN